MEFTEERLSRYSRHILLKDIGIKGQQKLAKGRVLIVGVGGLGSPVALYLAAAGVGVIGIADADVVDLSNLQRQIIHFTPDVGKPKVVSAARKIAELNPDVTVVPHEEFLTAENAAAIIRNYDFVVDGTDSFPAKYLINDACVFERKPFSHGGILRFNGQTMTVIPHETACYRCVFPTPPPKGVVPTCAEAGVLGAIAGMLGTIQAAETLKFLTGAGTLLTNTVLTFDALDMTFRKISVKRNPRCPICGKTPSLVELRDEEPAVCDFSPKGAP
ncbi:MAG: HesA/MoeB/ThiF family protein [Methylobacteriaceae bacterium]|jgi:adenylyltransferase/sulfurtransferase|nr:HesA/MoeB/ThiF family protein [Methylobacteriaceae bacterium]